MHKLLTALSECSEWGRVYILDFLATHLPSLWAVLGRFASENDAKVRKWEQELDESGNIFDAEALKRNSVKNPTFPGDTSKIKVKKPY